MGAPPVPIGPRPTTFHYAQNVTIPGSGNVLLPKTANGFYVGGTGDVTCLLEDGTSVTFTAAQEGHVYEQRLLGFVGDTTSASDIVALY